MRIRPKNTLRKRFIAADSDSLTIETIQTVRDCPRGGLSTKAGEGTVPEAQSIMVSPGAYHRLRILKLKGTWRANEYNELVFEVAGHKKSSGQETYTFKGSWTLNKNQHIEYVSEDGRDTLIFKGFWQIPSANRLVYVFEGSSTSRFEFRVQLESSSIQPKKGEIRYRIGVGVRQSRKTSPGQLITLYGEWKFGRNLCLSFQMDYGQGRIRAIEFGAEVIFGRNNAIFSLKNEFGKPLGISLTVTHKFLKSLDAKAFIRLKSRRDEYGVESGISIPF